MDNLKKLLGSAYKEDLSLEDVDNFLAGKKLVDLSTGDYVNVDKYNKAVVAQKEAEEKLATLENSSKGVQKELDDLKPKYDAYVQKEKRAELEGFAKEAGIDGQFIDYAISKLSPDEKDTAKALKEFATANPQFSNIKKVVDVTPTHETPTPQPEVNNMRDAVVQYYQTQQK